MSQTLHQQLVDLHIRASAWLDGENPEKFDPLVGICHNLTLNQSDSDRLTDLMAQWPGHSGNKDYPVPHPTRRPGDIYINSRPREMWDHQNEYARNRWALLDWLIEQTAPPGA